LSPRLAAIVEALPLTPSMRVLEVGCGPGAAARAVAERLTDGFLLAIDRSAKAIAQAESASTELVAAGRLHFVRTPVEDLELPHHEPRFDLAFAVRVGALDGRHPAVGERALACLREALTPAGRLFVDGGDPLRELDLGR
jgi:SAM-dependent methyltransferase